MEENLNQDYSTDEGLFDDFKEEETTPSEAEDETSNSEETKETEETVSDEPFLQIRYNKEDVGLSKEEAIELAQKGKNYDKLSDKFTQLNSELTKLASRNNMTVDEFMSKMGETVKKVEINKEIKSLKEQYPDTNEEVLKELAEQRVTSRFNENEKNAMVKEQETASAQDQEIRRQLSIFKQEYPNLEPDKLDKSVYDLVRNGYTLLEAYNKWVATEKEKNKPQEEAKIKASELNNQNEKKSYGDTTNIEETKEDDFLSGWNDI